MNPIDPVEKLLTMSDKPVVSDLVTARYLEAQNAPPMPDTRLQYKTYDDDVKSADELYDPMDFKKVGGLIRDNVVHSIQTRFPVVGDKYTLTVENVTYEKPKNTSLKDEKYALQHGQSVSDRLRGDWVLYDNTTGQEIQRKSATLLNVPRMTERGTFIRNGAEQGLKHMFRLRPGIYARIKGDGHPSVHINPAQLTGRQMSLDMDPETGIMIAKRGTRTYGVLPLLLASGVPEEAIRASWGDELYDMNYAKYGKMINPENKVFQEYQALYKDELEPIQLDEETTESTMGVPYKSLTPDALLQASNKVLKLSRSMSADDEDDRDSLAYQRVMGPADYIPERIVRDGGGLVRKMFQRVIRDGHLDSIESGAFQPHVDSVFLEDKHASYIDGASPFEAMDLNSMVSRIGEGGIGDIKAAPAETRGVNDSYLGFIDPIRCYSENHLIMTKTGWVPVASVTTDMQVACMLDGVLCFRNPTAIHKYEYKDDFYSYKSKAVGYEVTGNHRMWVCKVPHKGGNKKRGGYQKEYKPEYSFEYAKDMHNTDRRVMTAQHLPYSGSSSVDYDFDYKSLGISDVTWAAFIGWFLSEGSVSISNEDSSQVCISQTAGMHDYERSEIIKVLTDMHVEFSCKEKYIIFYSKDISEYLRSFGYCQDKYIPEYIFDMSEECRKACLDALMLGDGRRPVRGEGWTFTTTSKRLADGVELLLFTLGMCPSVKKYSDNREARYLDVYEVRSLKASTGWLIRNGRKVTGRDDRSNYYTRTKSAGYAYCVTVPGGLVYTKLHNHRPFWCGNSPECYSEDTEILTKTGWVSVKDMTMDMEYACLIDDLLMYKKADAINVYDFDGEMIGYDSTAISFCVTPNHRMYTVSLLDEEDAYHIVLACNMYEERDLQFFASGRHFHNTQIHLAPQNFSKVKYTGKVYCPTVPGGLVYVRRNEKAGFWCGNSLKVGLDVYMAYGTKKDSKGRLYANFLDKAGNSGYRPMDTIARSIVATPEFYDPMADPNEFIPAINKGKQIDYVKRKDVDFFLASSNNMMSIGAGTIPNIGGIRSNRTLMGCLHPDTELIVKIGASVPMHITAAEALKLYNDGVAVEIPVMTEDKTSYYWKEVRQILVMHSRPIFDIATEDGNVARVTDNHKWLVKDADGRLDLVESSKLSLSKHSIPKATVSGEIKWVQLTGIGVTLISDTDYTVDIDVDDNVYMLANGLFTHNSKYPLQALSLEKREAPLVQRKMTVDGVDTTTERVIAKQLGAKFAPVDGKVVSVSADEIVIKDREGQKHTIELYNNYPANQKGFITNTPLVQEGQRVHANDVLAKSNYTTDTGEAALGVNLRTAFLPAKNSANFEDAIVISESAAKKLASEQMHKFRGDLTSDTEYGKKKFLQLFGAGEYTKEQLDKIGDDGMPAPGTVFQKGDPVFLGTQIRDLSTAGLSRRASVPYVKLWEHEEPGTVIDVTQGKKHMTIYTKSYTPMRPGDKMCFDDQTEILTDSGWKFFKDLLLEDKVLTIDYHTGESRFVDYSDAYSYDVVDEKMYTLKTKRLDICTTKEHRHLVSCMNNSSYLTLKTSDEIFGKRIYHLVGLDLDSRYNFAGSKDDNPKEKWTKYTGKVYCVTVPGTHTMYVRRNGKAVWSGNSGRYGAKGVISEIRPDSQMPQDSQGRPMEVLMTPLGLPSRLNTAMLGELQLSKIAESRGQGYTIPDFITDDTIDGFVSKELKKYGLSEKEDLYDPVTGKTVPQVSTGLLYNYKLKHMAELKERGRGTGVYTSEDVPMKGEGAARRFGMMEASAVYAGGGMDVLRDAKLIRGQRNDDFWHDYKEGLTPQMPTTPLVHKKFMAYLRASGANIQRNGDLVHMYAATDNDMKDLTGNRKVTTASTFDSKNMHPIDGGLFDPKIFGADGDQWGYVDLPEPVLNPLMFKPIASIMGWTDTELKEYLQGSRHTKGDFGTIPLMEQLKSVDLKSELKKAKDVLKAEGRTTIAQRDLARKRIRAIEPMLREGKHPTDFFFTRMPILPPKHRTVTTIGDETNVAADANFLYKRMMDAADDLKAAKDNLPEEYQVDARESLYNAVNAVVGTMPTDDPKLEAKGVGGLLKWAFGKGSPKHSSAHRKIFGANLDMGGLGTITPDGDLSMDEVGIPEESAWKMFEPFVLRDLRQSGFSSLNAMREVLERTPEARRSLEKQMANRPILVNRAPTLWRYGIQGMYPKIVKDNSIHLNPNVCKVYNADFDGDSIRGSIQIAFSKEFFKGALEESQNCDILSSVTQTTEDNMLHKEAKVDMVNVRCAICDIPRIEESAKQLSETVTEWDVPEGVFTEAIDKATGKKVVAPVTKLSLHKDVDMYDVHLATYGAYKHIITVSKDDTLLTYENGEIVITDASTAKGKLVPRAKATDAGMSTEHCAKYIDLGVQVPLTFDVGVFLGMMIGDGWVDSQDGSWLSAEDVNIQKWMVEFINNPDCYIVSNHAAHVYEYDTERFGSSKAHRIWLSIPRGSARGLKDKIGSGAYNKRIPLESLAASKAHRLGVLVGLISTDGNISYSDKPAKGKKASQKSILFHTTSQDLRDNIIDLCFGLGVRATSTEYMGTNSKAPCYGVNLSVRDMAKLYKSEPRFRLIAERDEENMKLIADAVEREAEESYDSYDIVPYPAHLGVVIAKAAGDVIVGTERNRHKNKGFFSRDLAKLVAERMKSYDFSTYNENNSGPVAQRPGLTPEQAKEKAEAWIRLVEDESICWEVVTDVTHLGTMDGWDVTVPGPLTFTLGGGTFVQDSMSTHVPVSNEAVRAIKENMLPSRNLISPQTGKAHFIPRDGANTGLYLASRIGKGTPVKFRTEEEAEEAYRKGLIKIDTPIEIG